MNPITISIGSSHSFAVDSNGKLWGFGCNTDGQLGIQSPSEVLEPKNFLEGKVATASCGSHHTTIIDANDNLWCFGNGGDGRLGNNGENIQAQPIQIGSISNAKNISSGWRHSAVIDNNNILWTFGCNSNGQLGTGDITSRATPHMVMDIDRAYQVSCGGKHTSVVDCYGNLWTFGDNYQGQLGVPDWEVHRTPVWVSHVPNCRFVSSGWEHTAAIDINNNLFIFGSNDHGQLGLRDEGVNIPSQFTPTMVLSNVKTVACGGNHTIAITFDGAVYACGANNEGQCGLPEAKNYRTLTKVDALPPSNAVACNQSSLVVDTTGRVWGFGANCSGELGPSLSEFNKKGSVILKPPQVIEGLQMLLPFTRVKSARVIPTR